MLDPYAFQRHAPTALIIPHTGGLFPAPGPRPKPVAAASRPAEYLRASRPRAGPQHPPAPAACPASGLSLQPDYRLRSDQPPARAADAKTPPRKSPENALPDNFAFQVHQHPNTKPAAGYAEGEVAHDGPSMGRASHNSAIMRRGPPLPPPLDITELCQPPADPRQHRSAAGQAGPRFALPPGPPLAADTLPEPRTRKQGARSGGGRVRPRRATRSPSAVTRPDAHGATSCPSTLAPTPPRPVHAQSNASTASDTQQPPNTTSKISPPTSARPGASAESQNPPEKAARERLAPKPAPKADTRPAPAQGPRPRRPGRAARPQPASRQHGQPRGTAEGQPPSRTRTRNRGCPAKRSRHNRRE